jgi:hypothetical protein
MRTQRLYQGQKNRQIRSDLQPLEEAHAISSGFRRAQKR